jgi:UDP-3-O-[3-hydroxymyristoyl] glucosamine N-acyltransferase
VYLNVKIDEIIHDLREKQIFLEVTGDTSKSINGISAIEDAKATDLVFVDKKEYLPIIEDRKPAVVVTSKGLKQLFSGIENLVLLITPNVSLAHAILKQKYAPRDFSLSGWTDIHPSAVIHETATVGENTVIEPKVVVGQNVKIGKNCRIMAGTVLENDCCLGDHTTIHPNVVIGYNCELGNHVVIGSGTVIGSEGYGYAQDGKRQSHAIPQTGNVVIEDHVRLGANNCVDRATYHSTRIGTGTKIDNLCHIAHNVQIGENCLLTAMLCVAGSTKIGNRVITSGQTGILDHMTVTDDVVLVHRAGVSRDVEAPGTYAGFPLMSLTEYMKNTVVLRSATDLRRRIIALENKE